VYQTVTNKGFYFYTPNFLLFLISPKWPKWSTKTSSEKISNKKTKDRCSCSARNKKWSAINGLNGQKKLITPRN